MRGVLGILVLAAACGQRGASRTVSFGHHVRTETEERGLDERDRMVWGLSKHGAVTWSRMYDATITAAVELARLPDFQGPAIAVATGRVSLGRRGDASQLILLDLDGTERARRALVTVHGP